MSDHRCTGDVDTCRICTSRMEAAESAAEYVDDRMGDRYADRMVHGGWES